MAINYRSNNEKLKLAIAGVIRDGNMKWEDALEQLEVHMNYVDTMEKIPWPK